jgi:hypothetical protein
MSQCRVEIESVCELHFCSGRPVVRRKGEHLVRNGHADECCVTELKDAAVTPLFDVVGEWLGS